MKQKYRLFRRSNGIYFIQDRANQKQESLRTRDKFEAERLLHARNEAYQQPLLNLHIARAYLAASDPGIMKRTWQQVLDEIIATKQGETKHRWLWAAKDKAFDSIRNQVVLGTTSGQLLRVLNTGTVSTNVYLRRLHNFAIDMNWLPWSIIPKRQWPILRFKEKRAIMLDEHQRIIARERNPELNVFYQLCWHLGGSQSDVANLRAEDINWPNRTIFYRRRKSQTPAIIRFGESVKELLKQLPSHGPLFPRLAPMHEKHRAKLFNRRCRLLGIHEGNEPDPVATSLAEEAFDWQVPGHPDRHGRVEVTMTLLPEKFRPRRGAGGEQLAKERRIDENEGISILRAGREIFYGVLPGVQPSTHKVDIDRWIGIEIRFTPELDERFQVRNVKKGAEPINGLRDKLKDIIWKTVMTARKQIQSHWDAQEAAQQRERGVHGEAEDIAANTTDVSPKPVAGQDIPEPDREQKIRDAVDVLTKDQPEKREEVRKEIANRPLTIVPQSFAGNELFEIDHLGTTAIVKLNMRHPFYREVYSKLLVEIEREQGAGESNENGSIARLAQVGLDLLILAYARAEGMRKDPDTYYSDLRSYWGVHLKNMVQDWKKP
jgi:integrase